LERPPTGGANLNYAAMSCVIDTARRSDLASRGQSQTAAGKHVLVLANSSLRVASPRRETPPWRGAPKGFRSEL